LLMRQQGLFFSPFTYRKSLLSHLQTIHHWDNEKCRKLNDAKLTINPLELHIFASMMEDSILHEDTIDFEDQTASDTPLSNKPYGIVFF